MAPRFKGLGGWVTALSGAALLALTASSSLGQDVSWGWGRKPCPSEPCPIPETKPSPEMRPEVPPTSSEAQPPEAFLPPERFAALGGETVSLATPNMLGDFLATSSLRCVPVQVTMITPQTVTVTGTNQQVVIIANNTTSLFIPGPPGRRGFPVNFFSVTGTANLPATTTALVCYRVPAVCHEFKISEDENPRPQDRVFFNENNYSNVLAFARLGTDIGDMNVNRATIGFEKTFFDGNASIGLRAPVNTLNIGGSNIPGVNGHFTDIGDLFIILKGVLWEDREIGNIVSGGLAITVPTGSTTFANSGFGIGCMHCTLLQPYLGYAWIFGDAFIHGFTAVDIPTCDESTLFYQDIGVGYFLMKDRGSGRFLTAVVPTFEVHATIPLDRQGRISDMEFTPDVVDLTEGVTFEIRRQFTLAVGVAEPVTGPKPFDIEAIAQLNIRF